MQLCVLCVRRGAEEDGQGGRGGCGKEGLARWWWVGEDVGARASAKAWAIHLLAVRASSRVRPLSERLIISMELRGMIVEGKD